MQVYLGLGSNLGDREAILSNGIDSLARKVVIEQVSSLYETEPVGYADQPWFLNAVIRGDTELNPEELLDFVKDIERDLGRKPSFRYGPRSMDIDILLYGDRVVETSKLTIPHPRLTERAFVLVPLAEVAPDLVHPVNNNTVSELLAKLQVSSGVMRREWKGRQHV